MSHLFPERLEIGLAPAEVQVARRGVQTRRVACDAAPGAEPWHGALAALEALAPLPPSRVTVVLSNHFVRYAVVPWSDALGTPAEEEAYLRHHFAKVHGERARGWRLRSSEGVAGAPRLASAVDAALIEALEQRFPRRAWRGLVSVQPLLMRKFNAWRALVPAQGAWLVLAEPGRSCVALLAGGGWRTVQNGQEPWPELLERTRYRVHDAGPGAMPDLVLLAGARAPEAAAGGWKFREVA